MSYISLSVTIKFNCNMKGNFVSIGGFTGTLANNTSWDFDFTQVSQTVLESSPDTIIFSCTGFDEDYSCGDYNIAIIAMNQLVAITDIYVDEDYIAEEGIYPIECTDLTIGINTEFGESIREERITFDLCSACINDINARWQKEYDERH